MKRRSTILALVPLVAMAVMGVAAAYDLKPLPAVTPEACPAWQASQGLVIGALPYAGKDAARAIFDTKDLYKNGIVPILLVMRNDNDFPVTLGTSGVQFIDRDGLKTQPVHWINIVAGLLRGKKIRAIGIPTVELPQLPTGKGSDMIKDFREKSLETLTIPPGETARKVVFFRLGTDPGIFRGAELYITEIYNAASGEEMVFFEFGLKLPREAEAN